MMATTRSDATPWVNSRPPASHLVLLSELAGIQPGTKVRFIGCVNKYDASSATLRLVDKYPARGAIGRLQAMKSVKKQEPSHSVGSHEIELDVKLVLPPATPRSLFRIGCWIIVLGYVAFPTTKKQDGISKAEGDGADVQALLISTCGNGSSSGGMQNGEYVGALEARRKAMRSMEKVRTAHDCDQKTGRGRRQ